MRFPKSSKKKNVGLWGEEAGLQKCSPTKPRLHQYNIFSSNCCRHWFLWPQGMVSQEDRLTHVPSLSLVLVVSLSICLAHRHTDFLRLPFKDIKERTRTWKLPNLSVACKFLRITSFDFFFLYLFLPKCSKTSWVRYMLTSFLHSWLPRPLLRCHSSVSHDVYTLPWSALFQLSLSLSTRSLTVSRLSP